MSRRDELIAIIHSINGAVLDRDYSADPDGTITDWRYSRPQPTPDEIAQAELAPIRDGKLDQARTEARRRLAAITDPATGRQTKHAGDPAEDERQLRFAQDNARDMLVIGSPEQQSAARKAIAAKMDILQRLEALKAKIHADPENTDPFHVEHWESRV